MEKISRILPSSPRMKLMEVEKSQPARPGAPDMGRPMGRNSLGDRVILSRKMDEARQTGQIPVPEPAVTYKNPEQGKLKVIEDINNKFFSDPKKLSEDKQDLRDSDLSPSEAILKKLQVDSFLPEKVTQSESLDPQANSVGKDL